MGLIQDVIKSKISNFNRNLMASKAYLKEIRKNTPNKNILQQVEMIKTQWKNMDVQEKCDIICRFEAERSLFDHLKECGSDESDDVLDQWHP